MSIWIGLVFILGALANAWVAWQEMKKATAFSEWIGWLFFFVVDVAAAWFLAGWLSP